MSQTETRAPDDEENPWNGKTVLSLDGGGIKGYTSLLILRELMGEVERWEKKFDTSTTSSSDSPYVEFDNSARPSYLPCHYFDYIGGTSTGGIIAIMLGRLRASVQTTLELYEHAWEETFRKRQYRFRQLFRVREIKYEEKALRAMRESLPPPGKPSWDEDNVEFLSDSFRCKTIICTLRMEGSESARTPYLFRSYRHAKSPDPLERNPGQGESFQILEVARATSAAPMYFKEKQVAFNDPGSILSNPSWEIYKEVNQMHRPHDHAIKLFVSLGLKGRRTKKRRSVQPKSDPGLTTIVKNMRQLDEITEIMEAQIDKVSKQNLDFKYYRISVDIDYHNTEIEELRHFALPRVQQAIKASTKEREELITKCAAALVERRRERAQTSQWESFALGTRYRCPEPGCSFARGGKDDPFSDRNDLLDHLQVFHDHAPPNPENHERLRHLLNAGRTNSD